MVLFVLQRCVVNFLQWQQLTTLITTPALPQQKILSEISLMQHPSHEFEGSNFFSTFNEINPDELWLALYVIYVSIHEVVANMDPRICATLLMFHAFTGCDTVSAFCGKGKKTTWDM